LASDRNGLDRGFLAVGMQDGCCNKIRENKEKKFGKSMKCIYILSASRYLKNSTDSRSISK